MRLVLLLAVSLLASLPLTARADPHVSVFDGRLVLSSDLHFDPRTGALVPESGPSLDVVAAYLRAHPSMTLEIGAHTDTRGSEAYNLRITQRAADEVRMALLARGIAPARLRAVGYGESRPVADSATESGREANRRIELVVLQS